MFRRVFGTGVEQKAIGTCGKKPQSTKSKEVKPKEVNRLNKAVNRFTDESIEWRDESIHG